MLLHVQHLVVEELLLVAVEAHLTQQRASIVAAERAMRGQLDHKGHAEVEGARHVRPHDAVEGHVEDEAERQLAVVVDLLALSEVALDNVGLVRVGHEQQRARQLKGQVERRLVDEVAVDQWSATTTRRQTTQRQHVDERDGAADRDQHEHHGEQVLLDQLAHLEVVEALVVRAIQLIEFHVIIANIEVG